MGTHKPMGCASSVTSVTSTSSPKFMNSAQYSVMAERSSRRRCHKRTTLHNHRVCVLMDATEGNNLKYSNPCTSRGSSEVEEAKNLPSSVMKPFRSWMATQEDGFATTRQAMLKRKVTVAAAAPTRHLT